MNELFKKDITIRIMSVLFAVLLWLFVLDSSNPVKQKTITIPLKILNENSLQERGIQLHNKDYTKNISITVKGREEYIKDLTAGDFEASIDFSKVKSAQDKELPVDGPKFLGKEDVTIDSVKPLTITLNMEKIGKNPFKVELNTTGDLKPGYKIISTTVSPDVLPIQGLDSVVKSVASVKAFADITNLDRDLNVKRECKVYNKKGDEMPEFSKTFTVDIKIQVAKEVPLTQSVKGNPAKNYIQVGSSIKPQTVMITGAPEVLSRITELKVDAVDVENASANVEMPRRINLPEGVKLYNAQSEAVVAVLIGQITEKQFVIPKESIIFLNTEIDNSLKYTIMDEIVIVNIKGSKFDLDKLDINSFKAGIDVGGQVPGLQKLPLKLTLPGSVKLVQDTVLEVKIEAK